VAATQPGKRGARGNGGDTADLDGCLQLQQHRLAKEHLAAADAQP